MKYSIKTQLICVFVGILALTMVLCWGLNNFFLKSFYYQEKEKSFRGSYDNIVRLLESNDESGLQAEMAHMRYADNITFIAVGPSDFAVLPVSKNFSSESELSEMIKRLMENYGLDKGTTRLIHILEETDQYVIQEKRYPISGNSYMECYGTLEKTGESMLFLMSTPLGAVDDSVRLSNQFLLVTCLAAMVLAIILISVVTRGITYPILQLATLSKQMAGLNFENRYDGKQENEIGVLGNSINQMADQLKTTIDELQDANEHLKRDIEEKIQIDEVRKEFLSNVSHELKTPIALIQGYAEGLQEVVNDDPESRDFYCDVIIDEAEKMNQMVKKLLTLNHLEFGQDALTPEVFDLAEMLDTVISSNELIGQKQGISFERDYLSPCMVYADEFKIEEICTNYLSNAMHYALGEKRVRVTVEVSGDRVKTTVFNTGTQIPQEDLEKVWIKFFKVDKARTREYGGSGIGLSIVKAIMEAHNMPYGVYNTDNGVAFWFCLARAKQEQIKELTKQDE